jgi:hypothetical protein
MAVEGCALDATAAGVLGDAVDLEVEETAEPHWHSVLLRQMQSDCPHQRRLLALTCQMIREKRDARTEKRERRSRRWGGASLRTNAKIRPPSQY